jgi:hypothetical protein
VPISPASTPRTAQPVDRDAIRAAGFTNLVPRFGGEPTDEQYTAFSR